jgi:hypothetical protein
VSAAGPALVELAHRCQHRLAVLLAEEEPMPQTSPGWRMLAGRRRRTSSSTAFAATVAELAIGAPGGERVELGGPEALASRALTRRRRVSFSRRAA